MALYLISGLYNYLLLGFSAYSSSV
jgi:hypothetical protein